MTESLAWVSWLRQRRQRRHSSRFITTMSLIQVSLESYCAHYPVLVFSVWYFPDSQVSWSLSFNHFSLPYLPVTKTGEARVVNPWQEKKNQTTWDSSLRQVPQSFSSSSFHDVQDDRNCHWQSKETNWQRRVIRRKIFLRIFGEDFLFAWRPLQCLLDVLLIILTLYKIDTISLIRCVCTIKDSHGEAAAYFLSWDTHVHVYS